MKKIFLTAIVAMGINSLFANINTAANDTIPNDSTKNVCLTDTVVTDTAKVNPSKCNLLTQNDTVVTDSTTNKVSVYENAGEKAILALAEQMR